jgi:CubicO group peptidase (beta-lactamase class C family)
VRVDNQSLRIVRDTQRSAAIDAFASTLFTETGAGVVIAVLKQGEVLHRAGYGMAHPGYRLPWSVTTPVAIASVTKQMVGVLICRLVQQGVLELQQPVRQWLPELPSAYAAVTVDHLLTHRGGLRSDESMADLAGRTIEAPQSLDYLYRLQCAQHSLQTPAGTVYRYDCGGYRLLAQIAERACRASFTQLMQSVLFAPLEMHSTFATTDMNTTLPSLAPFFTQQYSADWRGVCWGRQSSGDGAVVSTISDMTLWARAILNERSAEWPLTTQHAADSQAVYRRGLMAGVHRGREYWGHTGLTGSGIFYFPKDELHIIFLGNTPDFARQSFAFELFDAWLPEVVSEGRPQAAAAFTASSADAATATFFDNETGHVLNLKHSGSVIYARYNGFPAYLELGADDVWRTTAGNIDICLHDFVTCSAATLQVALGCSAIRSFINAQTSSKKTLVNAQSLVGEYFCNSIGTKLQIVCDKNQQLSAWLADAPQPSLIIPLEAMNDTVFASVTGLSIKLKTSSGISQRVLNVSYLRALDLTYHELK